MSHGPTDPALNDKGLPPNYPFDEERETTPREVKARLDAGQKPGEDFLLIDCRLPDEWQVTRIEGADLIPLQQLPALYPEKLEGKQEMDVVVYCKMGGRSLQFTEMLRRQGFKNARSMAGGILLWNRDVNPSGPQY